jgi:hypothetical protein
MKQTGLSVSTQQIKLVVSSIAGKVVSPSNVGGLLVLDRLQFWTVCDPMAQTTTVAATSLICNVTRVNSN